MSPRAPPLTAFPLSYKGLVAEALRQLVGEECYRQDEVLPPGYCTGRLPAPSGVGVLPGGVWAAEPCVLGQRFRARCRPRCSLHRLPAVD